jgi:hypothetical protein
MVCDWLIFMNLIVLVFEVKFYRDNFYVAVANFFDDAVVIRTITLDSS